MKSMKAFAILAGALVILTQGTPFTAFAQGYGPGSGLEYSLQGGVQALNKNDTALADNLVNIPVTAALTYHLTSIFAAEGEFTWVVPIKQSIDVGSDSNLDVKTPDILAYQANLRATWPSANGPVRPYLTGGAGAVTFLSNTDADRLPQIKSSETAFALNFGAGVTYAVSGPWSLRADFRELVAFPAEDAAGLSVDGTADKIWMERGTIGLAYRF